MLLATATHISAPVAAGRVAEAEVFPVGRGGELQSKRVDELVARVSFPTAGRVQRMSHGQLVRWTQRPTRRGGCRLAADVVVGVSPSPPRRRGNRLAVFGERYRVTDRGRRTNRVLSPAGTRGPSARVAWFEVSSRRVPQSGFAALRLPPGTEPELRRRYVLLAVTVYARGGRRCRARLRRTAARLVRRAVVAFTVRVTSPAERPPRPAPPPTTDLLTAATLRLGGAHAGDGTGDSVAGAGDVNGDGLDDVIVGAPFVDRGREYDTGVAYVVFGSRRARTLDLHGLGNAGFRISGVGRDDYAGDSVAAAGDVNGDGLGDVIVGAPKARIGRRPESGAAYVVFGAHSGGDVDLRALGTRGFRIGGVGLCDDAGSSVAGAGDVNGDGLADVAVGEPDNCNFERTGGFVHVVFGRSSPGDVDTSRPGPWGFDIEGSLLREGDLDAAGAGDVNGDGLDDVVVGSGSAGILGAIQDAAFVVYGRRVRADVDVGQVGFRGFRVRGMPCDGLGYDVAGAGDVNLDGYDDVVLGAQTACGDPSFVAPRAYLIFGAASTPALDARRLGRHGFRIDAPPGSGSGHIAVAGGADVNLDGRPDVAMSTLEDFRGRHAAGAAYVVYGRAAASTTGLRSLGPGGLRFGGAAVDDLVADALDFVGDFNGDGRPELVLGSQASDFDGRPSSGAAYVTTPIDGSPGPCANPYAGGAGDDHRLGSDLGDRLDGAAGADRLSGLFGDDCAGGGAGRDRLLGGGGNDALDGGPGGDVLYGEDGTDRLDGGPGSDRLGGGLGPDRLTGGPGDDVVLGDPADDERFLPQAGGEDEITTESGNDRVDTRDRDADKVDCGPGRDHARADRKDRLRRCERVIRS
jgi:FG-GAP repeat/RTX calcium-binding nonapeptide repeat (4 copies)